MKTLTASKAARSARRGRITGAVMAGKSITTIARTEERSRAWVSRELASAESHHFITELVNYHQATMMDLFRQTLVAIAEGLKAEKQVLYEGKVVSLGPDHPVRLNAAKRFIELASIGRPMPEPVERERESLTLQELEYFFDKRRGDKS